MEFICLDNKYLLVKPEVVLTPVIDYAIAALDDYFKKFNAERYVTSGLRTPIHQLQIILDYAKQQGITTSFVAEDAPVKLGSSDNYIWQDLWSKLMVNGIIINPPYLAASLYDHKNAGGDVIPAGTIYQQTKHVTGNCFDMSSWRGNPIDNVAPNVDQEVKIIQVAIDLAPEIGILSYCIERKNNCLHINVNPLVANKNL